MVCHSLLQWTTFCQTSPWPIHLRWPHMAWLSFIELDRAVVHVVKLASCLWLWFQSVCPLMLSLSTYHLTWVSLTLDMGNLFTAALAGAATVTYLGWGVAPLDHSCAVKLWFSRVMCGCESWTIKNAECWKTDAFELCCWRRLLRVPWTTRRSSQSILRKSTLNIHWKDWCWSSNNLAT